MDKLYSNIKERRKQLGMTQDELADILGYKDRSSIAKIESGQSDLPQSKVIEFAKALNTSVSKLLGINNIDNSIKKIVHSRPIPILGQIACGQPLWADENYDGYFALDISMDGDFILIARGDSMIEAGIADGDKCFIKKKEEVRNGKIAVVLLDDSATLKRVYQTESGWILKAENKDFAPIIVEGDIHILGELVGVYKTYI